MKNTFVKVLSFMMALTMIVGAFGAITVSAAECAHEDRTAIETVAATCVKVGFTKYTCNDCGEEFADDVIPATGKHTWTNVAASAATCEDPAYSAHKKCSACDAVEGKNETAAPLGHAFNIPYTQAATCTEEGFTSKKCARCGKVDTANKDDVVDAAHKYIYTVVTAPTACTSGTVKVTCSACNYSENIIQEEDHNWVDMTTTTAVKAGDTCQYEWKKGKFCADCKTVHPDAEKNTSITHLMDEVDFDKVTAENLTAEIAALGYKVGDATSTAAATCTVARVYLAQCSICNVYAKCEEKKNDGKGHDWNNWGETTPDDTNANHAVDKKQTRTCKNCDATETKVVKAASACVYTKEGAKVVTAATCEKNGYTTFTCDLCSAVTTGDVTYKTGHNYSAAQYKSGTCDDGDAVYVKKCPNKGCEEPEVEVDAPEGADACKWVKVTRKATCIADAYYENECSVCKDTKAYTATSATDKPAAGFDKTNHVANTTDFEPVEENVVKASCTNKAKNRYLCSCGALVDLEVGEAPAHTKGTSYTDDKGNVTSVAKKDATCKATGYSKAGEICTVCGVIITAPTVSAINPKAHVADGVFVAEGDATCAARAYTTSYYSCCGLVDKIESGDKAPANHSDLKDVAEVAATCTTTGTKAHQKCNGCGKIYVDGVEKTATDLVTYRAADDKDLKHKWKAEAEAKVEETCTTDGKKAYFKCEHCNNAVMIGDTIVEEVASTEASEIAAALKIAKHGTQYTGRYAYLYNENVVPTCTEGAWGEIPNTPMCKKCVLDADKADAEKAGVDGTYWLVKLNHKNTTGTPVNAIGSANYDCTKPSYTVVTCKDCDDYTVFEGYAKAAKTAHDYDRNNDNKVDDKDIFDSLNPTCTTAGVNVFKCENCTASYETAGKAATGHHITTAGGDVEITFSCKADAWKAFDGLTCKDCGVQVNEDNIVHNYVVSTKDATCTEDGFVIVYCADCNDVASADTDKATGHVSSTLISTENGVETWNCNVCAEYWTKAVDAVIVETLSAEKIAAGEVVTYTYAVTGKETFSSYDVVIPYDAYGLVFVGVEANADLAGLYAFASAGEYYYYDEDSDAGYYYDGVGVSLVVEYDAEGNEQFVETSADTTTVLFTLTFVASKTASGDAYIGDQDLEIVALGDLNGDEIVTAADAQAIFKFIGTNNVAADVNADGIVNLADVAALATFAASAKTVKDYLVMVDEFDKLEDVVFALFEAGKLNDINGDRVVNISDAYYFIAIMNEEFADAPYEMLGYVLGNNDITMEALVNYLNVMISANGGR